MVFIIKGIKATGGLFILLVLLGAVFVYHDTSTALATTYQPTTDTKTATQGPLNTLVVGGYAPEEQTTSTKQSQPSTTKEIEVVTTPTTIKEPSTNTAVSSQHTSVHPGLVSFDLGDGYNVSFKLPDSEKVYDVETTTSDLTEFDLKYHDIYIYSAGNDSDCLTHLTIEIASILTSYLLPEYSKGIYNGNANIETPRTIDGVQGLVGYDWPKGNAGVDIKKLKVHILDVIRGYIRY